MGRPRARMGRKAEAQGEDGKAKGATEPENEGQTLFTVVPNQSEKLNTFSETLPFTTFD